MRERSQDLNIPRRMLANFKDPDRFTKNAGRQPWVNRREKRLGNSNAHLYLVRQMQCSVCHRHTDIHAHHLRSGAAAKRRGVGMKSPDMFAVPLCAPHHEDIHHYGSRREVGWFAEYAINPHLLADALWHNTGDIARLNRVLLAHKLAASRELLRRRQDGRK